MVDLLRARGVGCHILNMFVACILFADDMALLAPSRKALQVMIDIIVITLLFFVWSCQHSAVQKHTNAAVCLFCSKDRCTQCIRRECVKAV